MLNGKKIVLGVTGGIAAYKVVSLLRLLKGAGAEVKVIMTEGAKDFVAPLTFSSLSGNPVFSEFFDKLTGAWYNHVDLALWADLIIIAPATANTIAKMANGICDNIVLATYLSAKSPVFIAPAMDREMYAHPSTKFNLNKLIDYGVYIIPAAEGELASGLIGEGRMAEPDYIFEILKSHFEIKISLFGKKCLVTAGPTYEHIDPVRFIGNRSTGKMGFAIAEKLAEEGAMVTLISGPVALEIKHQNIQKIQIETSEEMYNEASKYFNDADVAVFAAAVADYAPKNKSGSKIKKKDKEMNLELVKTMDILGELSKRKKSGQILVGFALETDNQIENAKIKLANKNLDFVVLNSLGDEGAGFGYDTNNVTIIDKLDNVEKSGLKAKTEIAADIVKKIVTLVKTTISQISEQ